MVRRPIPGKEYRSNYECISFVLGIIFFHMVYSLLLIHLLLLQSGDVLLDFSLTVKATTLIFISGRCSASSSDKQGKSGSI